MDHRPFRGRPTKEEGIWYGRKKTLMDYSAARDWVLAESGFDPELLGKCEAVMCQGNGYMGLRCATEERYLGEQRNLFVAGTFNKFDENEVTELPNAADVLAMTLRVNGENFDLTKGSAEGYRRALNLRTGEVTRTVRWTSPKGVAANWEFRRIVSLERLHVIAQQVLFTPETDVTLVVETGINGQMTNTGSQHFSEGEKRLYDGLWQYCTVTGDSKFMDDAGYELMMDTAIYWVSRMTEGEDGKLHILDVVGPDEYKEHVDDNAFTNYMAH